MGRDDEEDWFKPSKSDGGGAPTHGVGGLQEQLLRERRGEKKPKRRGIGERRKERKGFETFADLRTTPGTRKRGKGRLRKICTAKRWDAEEKAIQK